MPPKKKSDKHRDDGWEAELGETPNDAPGNSASGDVGGGEEAEGGGSGLLAALKKNKSKRAKKGKPSEDFQGDDDLDGLNSSNINHQEPEEAKVGDDGVLADATKKGKPEKKSLGKPTENIDDEKGEGGGLKSKKEKEKEKKEREKQRKKEQAAKKKSSAPTQAPIVEAVKAAPEVRPESPPPAAEAAGKKKKVPAHLAAIQKQQEALQRQREEQQSLDAKERAAEDERLHKLAEEEKIKEESRSRKREKEKEKKEQLKKEGKFMSEAEKKRRAQQDLRMKQMLDSGAKIEGLNADPDVVAERKKPAAEKKKKAPKKQEDDLEAAAERAREQAEEAATERDRLAAEADRARAEVEAIKDAEGLESDGPEDWDKANDAENVKESWDAESEDDAEAQDSNEAPRSALRKAPADANGVKPTTNGEVRGSAQKESESEDETESEEEGSSKQTAAARKKAEAATRRQKAHEEALAARSKDNLRSPICCILGHVDTGKTKLLDKVRHTNVQEGEAGGITQQIGATYFPTEALREKVAPVNKDMSLEFKVPGLLIIDTPGHESFSNLRSRGSSLCNIAILVVDIMHGLEPQTLESMRLLRDRKTPFIVALNKIDRLYNWKKIDNNGFLDSLAMQNKGVQSEFRDRLETTKVAFAEQGFNSELFSENKSMAKNVSLVPTSAHTGEGIPDLLKLLVSLTQERMTNKLMYLSEVECTVLEVKVIEGLGTTIDVVLSNGLLHEGDRIVLCGLNGAITTNIRALLTPAPLKELRLKSAYVHNKEVTASLGVKIAANDLEGAIAGSRLLVVGPEDDEEDLEDEVMGDLAQLLNKVSKDSRGVSVQASTLGSLEALLEFLKVSKIPVANISIGPVYKRDVMMAGTMLEKAKQYAVMLCFDVKIDKEAQAYADDVGVKIFTADIIYHLFDDFTKHMAALAEQKKEENKLQAVFPCVLTPVKVFNKKDPVVIGIDVTEGNLRLTTPIAAVKTNPVTNVKEVISIGRVTSIERDHKQIPLVKKGAPSVAVKIEGPNQPLYGRQLEESDMLYSMISRTSIDTLKEFYRADVSTDEWQLIRKLKPLFDIP